jgi:acetyl-CoA carboxylase biotin carboxyl carrier protein
MPPKKTTAPQGSESQADAELSLIRSMADILNETGLSEIEIDRRGTKLRVARSLTVAAAAPVHAAPAVHHAAPAAAAHPAPEPAKAHGADHPGTVKSPMVGTIYRASAPGAANFVEVGQEVKEGQTLLIIEAMKTMNQIPAPRAGRITHIFVDTGHPVEFGEPLVVIE